MTSHFAYCLYLSLDLGHEITVGVFYCQLHSGMFIMFPEIWMIYILLFPVFKLSVRYYRPDKKQLGTALLYLTAVGKLTHTQQNLKS